MVMDTSNLSPSQIIFGLKFFFNCLETSFHFDLISLLSGVKYMFALDFLIEFFSLDIFEIISPVHLFNCNASNL